MLILLFFLSSTYVFAGAKECIAATKFSIGLFEFEGKKKGWKKTAQSREIPEAEFEELGEEKRIKVNSTDNGYGLSLKEFKSNSVNVLDNYGQWNSGIYIVDSGTEKRL